MAQRDPFSWAEQYANSASQAAGQERGHAQQTLLNVFQQEAMRQRPFATLPAEMAQQRNSYDLALRNNMASAGIRQQAAQAKRNAPTAIVKTIEAAAKAYGIDPDALLTFAEIESRFDPMAKNKSGASGLFQFMPETAQQYGLADPFNAEASAHAAARLYRDNAATLKKRLGRDPTAAEVYLAHQQGSGGASSLLSSPNISALDALTIAYDGNARKARAALLQNGGRPGMTAQQFANQWLTKFDSAYQPRAASRSKSRKQQQEYVIDDKLFTLELEDDETDAAATDEG